MKLTTYTQHHRFGQGPQWLCVFNEDGNLLNVRRFRTDTEYLDSRDDIKDILQCLGHDVELAYVIVDRKLLSYEAFDEFISQAN